MITINEFFQKITYFKKHPSECLLSAIFKKIEKFHDINYSGLHSTIGDFHKFKIKINEVYSSNQKRFDKLFSIENQRIEEISSHLKALHHEFMDAEKDSKVHESRFQTFLFIGLAPMGTIDLKRWYKIKLMRHERQVTSYFHHLLGNISYKKQKIVPKSVLMSRQDQLLKQQDYIESAFISKKDENGIEMRIPFKDVCKTKYKLASKSYVRLKGVEFYAKELGLVGFFITLTLSPEYHPSPKNGNRADSNLKCNTCHRLRFADVITSFVLVLSTTSA